MQKLQKPTLRNLTKHYGKPSLVQNELLKEFGKLHIDSFNYFVTDGLRYAIRDLQPVEFLTKSQTKVKLQLISATIHPPQVPLGAFGTKTQEIYPLECRQKGISYSGQLEVRLAWYIDDKPQPPLDINLANVPIMLKSVLCNLTNLSPEQLIRRGEQETEWGGYFIIKGKERLIRLLLNSRRNYPIAVKRSSWKGRDINFSDTGIMIRCVSEDQTAVNNVLHFLTDGTAKLMISFRRNLFYAPVFLIMKCLVNYDDVLIFQYLIKGFENDGYFKNCIMEMMRSLKENDINNQTDARNYIGKLFKIKFYDLPPWTTDDQVCQHILKNCVLIHLKDNKDKFRLLVFMIQKLFQVKRGLCLLENPDAIMLQELLVGGHLYLKVMKEKLQYWLNSVKANIQKRDKPSFTLTEKELVNFVKKSEYMESTLETFFATGSLVSESGLGLQQDKGLTIMAENISIMRYMAHFRGVHRGSVFEQMRMTEPRQLLPDAWGFICPVHTPDGTPCGLLNHLTRMCQVADSPDPKLLKLLPSVLVSLGMTPITESSLKSDLPVGENQKTEAPIYVVMLDGRIIGHVDMPVAETLTKTLRYYKITGKVPKTLEIVLLEFKDADTVGQFPGLFLFTGNARMMRPVLDLNSGQIELIGTFEQVYMDIAVAPDEIIPGVTTHQELQKADFLSFAASLIPMPDYNQSPRNMYQCQMGKQTMGTPCHNWQMRADTKLYRLQTPCSPLFRPLHHDLLRIDDYPMGTNAIVAVISYTGYDMEDAMIINKSSLERGFAHGSIYKCDLIELKPLSYFELDPHKPELADRLDGDGLPFVGLKLKPDDVYYSYYDSVMQTFSLGKYTGKEEVYVDTVRLCGDFNTDKKYCAKASVLFRLPRNPSVGDKFASRAGQKGIFSVSYRTEDLPFTESGMVPDIVFNPHGFPSRMTIAMMIECMAGKSAAIVGEVYDASPFQYSEDKTAIDVYGNLLQARGFNYYGNEIMYSGVNGAEMPASIFFGVVHYQRLRHMVSDKWQVRNTGPVDIVTRQPLKGRKRGGGGRVGEMERDALISHGTPYLLQDRFADCSDKSTAFFCRRCKTLVGPTVIMEKSSDGHNVKRNVTICKLCNSSNKIQEIGIPYIFRYLSAELASVSISLKFHLNEEDKMEMYT